MAAIGCHIVALGPKPIANVVKTVLDKSQATIGQMAQATSEIRVLQNSAVPNSTGYPCIEDYIMAEASIGYVVRIINQSWIITYPAGS